jgi:tagatose-1,6-bisphosphate aldolase
MAGLPLSARGIDQALEFKQLLGAHQAAAALGSVTFSYLRADATTSLADASGFIFMDGTTAARQGLG